MDVVSIHPLVLMSVSDHFTRDQFSKLAAPSVGSSGLLFGVQGAAGGAEIFTSCDMPLRIDSNSSPELDKAFVEQQKSLSKYHNMICGFSQHYLTCAPRCNLVSLAFAGYELLGWYIVTESIAPQHMKIHKQIQEHNESPLLLHLRPAVSEGLF